MVLEEKQSEFDQWWKKNALDMFWYKQRLNQGFDPNEPMTLQERMYWGKIQRIRRECEASDDPRYVIYNAPSFDKQMFLQKWWNHLTLEEKKEYLLHVWGNKGDGNMYGFDWWLPYFQELGFISNVDITLPTSPITLYRGIEPLFQRGMSWTTSLEMANVFANESVEIMGKKKIFKTVVKPENILAIVYGDIREYQTNKLMTSGIEYVVNHQTLEDIGQLD